MANKKKPGCLFGILSISRKKPKANKKTSYIPQTSANNAAIDLEVLPYALRDDFLSPAELNFFRVLRHVTGDHLLICPKVALGDLFFVKRPNENQTFRNRIDRKHVDFVLLHPKSMRPVFAIELDDKSHDRLDRMERDEFVNEVFEAANLPLVRVRAQNTYDTRQLETLFRQAVNENLHREKKQSPIKDQDNVSEMRIGQTPSPICPKCNIEMVLRVARRGAHTGEQFYGCPNYPNCRETAPMTVNE